MLPELLDTDLMRPSLSHFLEGHDRTSDGRKRGYFGLRYAPKAVAWVSQDTRCLRSRIPCTPWSMLLVIGCRCCVSAKLTSSAEAFVIMIKLRRGKGKGFQDSNAKPFWVGLETIKGALPKTFILECVEAMSCRRTTSEPESESSHDLEEATLQIIEKLGDQYHVMSLRLSFSVRRCSDWHLFLCFHRFLKSKFGTKFCGDAFQAFSPQISAVTGLPDPETKILCGWRLQGRIGCVSWWLHDCSQKCDHAGATSLSASFAVPEVLAHETSWEFVVSSWTSEARLKC